MIALSALQPGLKGKVEIVVGEVVGKHLDITHTAATPVGIRVNASTG